MYFVDRSKIEQTLVYIDTLLLEFDKQSFNSTIENLGLERLTHMLIESILDVGNMMIDGFIMRDPGSYEDIIDILIDEKVLPDEYKDGFKEVIRLRNIIVRDYLNINHKQLKKVISTHQQKLKQFSTYVTTYLENELKVANAFSNEELKK